MSQKINRKKCDTNVINIALLNAQYQKECPAVPNILKINTKKCEDLRKKVHSLVHLQLKKNQSNQNFLGNVKPFKLNINVKDNLKQEQKKIYLNTKYEIVAKVSTQVGFNIVTEDQDWNILWIDGSISSMKIVKLKRHQRVNHFPGMIEISRKDKLQRNLKIMQRYFFAEYDIFPKTWSLPSEKEDVIDFIKENCDRNGVTFIIKPACSSQGRGILLVKDMSSLFVHGNTICQVYIPNPFLIDGFKFDLRMYVLITSCDPFRIFVYEEGLARFATCYYEKPESKNLDNIYMHLTNYSLQKNSDKFDKNEIYGTKRRATTIYYWFKNHGYDADKIWKSIDDVLIKTMLCVNNSIKHCYEATFPDKFRTSACFELLGFDIILDENLKPYVLEVNHSPSLDTETTLDLKVKTRLLKDIFNIINAVPYNNNKITYLEQMRTAERLYWSRNQFMSRRKASIEFRKILSEMQLEFERCEMDNKNGFRIIYPVIGQSQKYQKFFEFNCADHRNYLNRYGAVEEPEHKLFMDLPKQSFPKVINKAKRYVLLHRNPAMNLSIRNTNKILIVNNKIANDKSSNSRNVLTNKLRDKLYNTTNENKLNQGTKLSSLNVKTLKKSNKFKKSSKSSQAKSEEILKLSNSISDRTLSSLLIISEPLSKKTTDSTYNASELDLNDDLISNMSCESFTFLKQKKEIKKNIFIVDQEMLRISFSEVYELKVPELQVQSETCLLKNIGCMCSILHNARFVENNRDSQVLLYNPKEISYNAKEQIQESLLIANVIPTKFFCYLPSIKTQSDLVIFTLLTENKFESIYSTGFSINYLDFLKPKLDIVNKTFGQENESKENKFINFMELNESLELLSEKKINYAVVEFFDNSSVSKKLHYIEIQHFFKYAYSINNKKNALDETKWINNLHDKLYRSPYMIKKKSKPNFMFPITTYLRGKDYLKSGQKVNSVSSIYNLHMRQSNKMKKTLYLNDSLERSKDKSINLDLNLHQHNNSSATIDRYTSKTVSYTKHLLNAPFSSQFSKEELFNTNNKTFSFYGSHTIEIDKKFHFRKERNKQSIIKSQHFNDAQTINMCNAILKKEKYFIKEKSGLSLNNFYFAKTSKIIY